MHLKRAQEERIDPSEAMKQNLAGMFHPETIGWGEREGGIECVGCGIEDDDARALAKALEAIRMFTLSEPGTDMF